MCGHQIKQAAAGDTNFDVSVYERCFETNY